MSRKFISVSIRYISVVLLMWIERTNSCLLEHHRNKMARDSTFTCSLKSISSYHFIYIFLYFSMTMSTYCFFRERQYQLDGIGGGEERLPMPILYSSSFQSSFHPLFYKNENLHKTLAR